MPSEYCINCSNYICHKCTEDHACGYPPLFYFVKFSYRLDTMLPYCKQHDSLETMCCLTCKMLCCKYCEHDSHGKHFTMTLENYNKAKFEENITKELQKIYAAKGKLEILQKDAESRNANISTAEANFFKSLAQRKNILIARCLDMISGIEKKYQEIYCKRKLKYKDELLQMYDVYSIDIEKCNSICDLQEKYSKSSSLEKYFNWKQLALNIKECRKSLNKDYDVKKFDMKIRRNHTKDDDLLFHSLNHSFGVCVAVTDSPDCYSENYKRDLRYEPSQSFQDVIENDKETCSFIQRRLEEELIKSERFGECILALAVYKVIREVKTILQS